MQIDVTLHRYLSFHRPAEWLEDEYTPTLEMSWDLGDGFVHKHQMNLKLRTPEQVVTEVGVIIHNALVNAKSLGL